MILSFVYSFIHLPKVYNSNNNSEQTVGQGNTRCSNNCPLTKLYESNQNTSSKANSPPQQPSLKLHVLQIKVNTIKITFLVNNSQYAHFATAPMNIHSSVRLSLCSKIATRLCKLAIKSSIIGNELHWRFERRLSCLFRLD